MFRELLSELIKNYDWASLKKPCDEGELAGAEKRLGCSFPEELKALLRETDGDGWFLLSVREIIEASEINRRVTKEYFKERGLEEKPGRNLCFAANGCGDYYCYRLLPDGTADKSAIYLWEHELSEIRVAAANLTELIEKYYNNEI